jgi:hypothetical protein
MGDSERIAVLEKQVADIIAWMQQYPAKVSNPMIKSLRTT